MVKKENVKAICFRQCLRLAVFIAFVLMGRSAYTEQRFLQYLPQNQTVETVSKDLGVILGEASCKAAEELFQKATDCFDCVYNLRPSCPECCLVFNPVRAKRCTPQEDAKYNCKPLAFEANSCGPLEDCDSSLLDDCKKEDDIPLCQRLGCATSEPKPSHGHQCIKQGNKWVCTESGLTPKFTGCNATDTAKKAGLKEKDCVTYTPYYSPVIPVGCPAGLPKNATCYEYSPSSNYKDCIDKCLLYTDEWERCIKGVNCCRQSTCESGFDTNCNIEACDKRIARPECDGYEIADCVAFQKKATDCLMDLSGKCHECFYELDSQFYYKFVAKSREKIVVIWQIAATPQYSGGAPTYFYTMVKIIDDTTGFPVHESIVNQKSFEGAFSIFSATSVGNLGETLEAGRSYTARLYYFIPPVNMGLSIKIDRAQLIVVRVRE